MRIFRLLSGLSIAIAASLSAIEPEQLYPQGDLLPIGGYSPRPERDKEAGFTLAGPAYRNHETVLEECERVGLPCIYPVGVKFDFRGKKKEAPQQLDHDEIRREIRSQVEAVMENRGIVIWYLVPEELRYWRSMETEYLQLAYETIRQTDPYQRPVWMYEPGHRTAGALGRLLPWLDISGKGMYVNYSSRMDERVWTRWTMEQQQRAIDESNPHARSIAVPEMFRQPPTDRVREIPVWVRHDAYSSLMNGAKAIVIFSFGRRRNFESHEDYYNAWAAVARELTAGEEPLGTVFLRGAEQSSLPALEIVSGPEKVTLSASSTVRENVVYPALQVKRYLWNNRDYLFLLNSTGSVLEIDLHESGWRNGEGQPVRQFALPAWGVEVLRKPL